MHHFFTSAFQPNIQKQRVKNATLFLFIEKNVPFHDMLEQVFKEMNLWHVLKKCRERSKYQTL